MPRPPALSPAQKRSIIKMVKENPTIRNEFKRIVSEVNAALISSLVFAPVTPPKVVKKKHKKAKRVKKKAVKAVKKKAVKAVKKKLVKKKKRKKSNRVYVAPKGKRKCGKCKKTMKVHPRSMDCPKCGAKKSLKKVK